MGLVDDVEFSLKSLDTTNPVLSTSVVELTLAIQLFRRWSRNPAYPSLLDSLRVPGGYTHALLLMATGTMLNEARNDVGLGEPTRDSRSPDLYIAAETRLLVGVEIKAPMQLQNPPRPLLPTQAGRIVSRSMKSAGTGKHGQLARNRPGLLAVGGVNLQELDVFCSSKPPRRS